MKQCRFIMGVGREAFFLHKIVFMQRVTAQLVGVKQHKKRNLKYNINNEICASLGANNKMTINFFVIFGVLSYLYK